MPAAAAGIADLPVVEIPASAGNSDALAFIASGDGGWARLDKQVATVLTAQGIPVVGLNTLRYYWHEHPPDESAQALETILRHYLQLWSRERVLLIGYSRGADVLPFMASRLPADLRTRVDLLVLLGPGSTTTFQFHIAEWFGWSPDDALPVPPEILKLDALNLLCLYGSKESRSACTELPEGFAKVVEVSGGHHFGRRYDDIARRILEEAQP